MTLQLNGPGRYDDLCTFIEHQAQLVGGTKALCACGNWFVSLKGATRCYECLQ